VITPWENTLPSVSTLTIADPALLVQISDSHMFAEAHGYAAGHEYPRQPAKGSSNWCAHNNRRSI
jgi:hypothetical protein